MTVTRNERDAREKIENEWVGDCARISKTRNWPSTINHSLVGRSVGRSFGLVPFRGHPERARCLISLSDSERRCRYTTSLRVTTGTGYTYTRPVVVHVRRRMLHRVTRTHTHTFVPFIRTSACSPFKLTTYIRRFSRVFIAWCLFSLPRITILIAVEVLTGTFLVYCRWNLSTSVPACVTMHAKVYCSRKCIVCSVMSMLFWATSTIFR